MSPFATSAHISVKCHQVVIQLLPVTNLVSSKISDHECAVDPCLAEEPVDVDYDNCDAVASH